MRKKGIRQGTGSLTVNLTPMTLLPSRGNPCPNLDGWTPLQSRANTGDEASLGCSEEGWAQRRQALMPRSNGFTAGEHLGPECRDRQCAENKALGPSLPLVLQAEPRCHHGPQSTPASPLPPSLAWATSLKQQQHLLQIQVPREVKFASLWLMEVPRNIAVIQKIITGLTFHLFHFISHITFFIPKTPYVG